MLSEIPRTNSMTNCRIGWVTTTTPMRFPSTRSTRCSRLAGGAEAVLHVVSNRRGKQIQKTYVQMNPSVKNREAPALVVIGSDGKQEMVNYRVKNDIYIVDRLFDRAALILGT